jgi:hypothetical protein
MKPSSEVIKRMRERGFDPVALAAEKQRLKHFQAGLKLCPLIETAFAGVTLGGGVGLMEAQAIDDYADAGTRGKHRAEDEKLDWRKLSFEKLRQCNSSLSFFDAEGMRFHLPAYLICELNHEYGFALATSLSMLYEGGQEKYSLLSPEQRDVVRKFLLHMLHDRDHRLDRPHIERALNEYWV